MRFLYVTSTFLREDAAGAIGRGCSTSGQVRPFLGALTRGRAPPQQQCAGEAAHIRVRAYFTRWSLWQNPPIVQTTAPASTRIVGIGASQGGLVGP